jgi:hypothetical protein
LTVEDPPVVEDPEVPGTGILDMIKSLIASILDAITDGFDWIKTLLQTIKESILGIPNAISNAFDWVRSLLETIIESILGIPDAISNAFDWVRSLLETIKDAIASISTAITTGLIGDLNVDTSVIRDIGSTFTSKFPFSLPWDLVRAVDIFDGSSGSLGPWVVSFPDPFGNSIQFEISIPQGMAAYFKYIRWALLIAFDIGLIYATRRLLGGAQ